MFAELPFETLFYLTAGPAVLLAGISKGGFAGGAGFAAVPLMALTVPPAQAAAIMLPILCVIDIVNIVSYWRKWDKANMRILVIAAMVGITLGALTFRYMSADMLRVLVGLIAVSFTVRFALGKLAVARGGPERPAAGPSAAKGGFWGAVAGYTSFIAHAGGPPVSVYLLPQRLDKTVFQATTVVAFIFINYVKLLPYALLGQFTEVNLTASALFFPLAIAGALLGVWMHNRVNERIFYALIYSFVFATGGKLLYDGITGLLGGG